jgi:hypothetical protein
MSAVQILPGTGRGTAKRWRGLSTSVSPAALPLHHSPEGANGPPPRAGEDRR